MEANQHVKVFLIRLLLIVQCAQKLCVESCMKYKIDKLQKAIILQNSVMV